MIWHSKLYLSNEKMDVDRVKWHVEHNAGMGGYYLICLSPKEEEMAWILSEAELQKDYIKKEKKSLTVIGVARGLRNAKELIGKMTEDALDLYNEADFRLLFPKEDL